ncbi:hypothetical protein KSC_110560 [Ktedonobacter sp. SOSP1-52]|nr:hypothetical protein KSC_110560 [Ktedonobacter sp. SOSP1-52]
MTSARLNTRSKGDQYALACIAYELFTGHVPFTAPGLFALGFQHLTADPPPPRQYNSHLPLATETAILKALSKQQTDRYTDILAFLAALSELFVQATMVPALASTVQVHSYLSPSSSGEGKSRIEWIKEGEEYFRESRYEDALKIYEQAIAQYPDDMFFYIRKAYLLEKLKRYEEALAVGDQAIALDPHDPRAYETKASTLNDLRRYEESLATYEQALALAPQDIHCYKAKGALLEELKRYEEALAAYSQALALDPEHTSFYAKKGALLEELKRYEEALDTYSQALNRDPHSIPFYRDKGQMLTKLKRYEEAALLYDQALALDPYEIFLYRLKGMNLEKVHRYEEALITYEQALVRHPQERGISLCNMIRCLSGDTSKPISFCYVFVGICGIRFC